MASNSNQLFAVTLFSNVYKRLYRLFGAKGLAILATICGIILKFRVKKHNITSAPMYLPIVGHVRLVSKYLLQFEHTGGADFLSFEADYFKKLGAKNAMFALQIPTQTQIFVADPKIADNIFRQRFSEANKGESSFGPLKVVLGNGIFTANGENWKKQRNIASHMFTVRALKDCMFETFVSSMDRLLEKFEELKATQSSINMYDMFNRLTFEAFTKIAFGVDVKAIESAPKQCEFAYRFDRTLAVITNRTFSSVNWKIKKKFQCIPFVAPYENEIDEHAEWLELFIQNIISDRKEYFEKTKNLKNISPKEKKAKYDLLSMFMADNANISNVELRDIALNFIIAGKDTTAQTLSWFMYLVFGDKLVEIEEKIRDEIKNVFGMKEYEGNCVEIMFKKVAECKYIECCLKETLRLYPSVPHLVRTALKDIKVWNGKTIKKGDEIYVSAYAMGRMPWIWNEPNEFKPERFADAKNQPDPSKYPAFNIAPRICLGKHVALMEAKIAIIKLFCKYKKIRAVEGQEIKWIPSPTMQMSKGFECYLE